MQTHKEIFDAICRGNRVRPLDLTTLDLSLLENQLVKRSGIRATELIRQHRRRLVTRSRKAIAGQKMPEFYLGCVDSPWLDAWATFVSENGIYCGFIAVYAGAVKLIYDVFYRMLAHPHILPNLGDSSAESIRQPFCAEGIYNNYQQLLNSRKPHEKRMESVLPIDPRRMAYAERLAQSAVDFFIFHELSHVTYGHCEYLNTQGLSLLMEIGRGRKKIDPITSQALEFHADSSAAFETWKHCFESPTSDERIGRAKLEQNNRIVIPEELSMFDWVFTIFVMFWIMGQQTDPVSLSTEPHPPPSVRVLAAMASARGWFNKTVTKDRQERFDTVRVESFQAACDALNTLAAGRFIPHLDEYLRVHASGAVIEHYRKISRRMQSIIEDVKKFAHCEFNYRFQATADLPTTPKTEPDHGVQ